MADAREAVGVFDGFGAVAACRGAGRNDRFQVGRKMRTASVRGRSDRKSAREMERNEARGEVSQGKTFLADDRVFADGVGKSVVSVERDRRVAAPAKQSVPGRTER